MTLRPACALSLLALCAGAALTQCPLPPLPLRGPSPLLFVRFSGPAGMRASFYQGRAPARTFAVPVVVGMRPGYAYRVGLHGMTEHPDLFVFPTLEIHGSLHLSAKLGAAAFPATVHLTDNDVTAIAAGSLITKVIYLENPDRAVPKATLPGEILEADAPPNADLLETARDLGRIMILVHLGGRVPTPEELAHQNVPGTILFPGERAVAHAVAPPQFVTVPAQFFDPKHGPQPHEEECLHDGGDRFRKATLNGKGELRNLDPEDTVAEFTDSHGHRSVTCSNRICLCVPRYAVLRKVCPLARSESYVGPGDTRLVRREVEYAKLQPSQEALQYERLKDYEGRLRPSENVNVKAPAVLIGLKLLEAHHIYLGPVELLATPQAVTLTKIQRAQILQQIELARQFSVVKALAGLEQVVGTAVVGKVEGLDVVSAMVSTRDITVCCGEPCPPDKPLVLVKCADRGSAQVGDVVTFMLRYSNHGGRPISDVAVSDSLSARLEYVPDSAESDRDAVFTIQENEVGSVVLRWEISGRLMPGQSGRIRFKARVR
jgi:uncharacterized repeat protein (TIGR01451 family)